MDFPYITEQINRVLSQFEKYKFSLLGYSMGGRVALTIQYMVNMKSNN